MEQLQFSLNATVPIFLLMLVGYGIRRLGIINDAFTKTLDTFTFKVSLPILLIRDLAESDFYSVWDTEYVLFCFLVTLTCIVALCILVSLFCRDKDIRGELIQASYRSSAAILGIAFITNIYGSVGVAPLMIIGTVPLYNLSAVLILSFTGPNAAGFDKASIRKSIIGIIKNPIILAIFIGMVLSALPIEYPVIVQKTVGSIASVTSPMALIGLGAGFQGKKALKLIKPTLFATFCKLFLFPALFLPLALSFGFTGEKLISLLIMLGSPTTVSCYIMARNMHHEGVLTSSAVMLTTLLSSVSLTLYLFILRSLGVI